MEKLLVHKKRECFRCLTTQETYNRAKCYAEKNHIGYILTDIAIGIRVKILVGTVIFAFHVHQNVFFEFLGICTLLEYVFFSENFLTLVLN